jgi:hypothetical protein
MYFDLGHVSVSIIITGILNVAMASEKLINWL